MSTATRVGAFLLGLACVFATSAGLGAALGPSVAAPEAHVDARGHGADHSEPGLPPAMTAEIPGGLMRAQDGYSLDLQRAVARPGDDVPLALVISGPDGSAVTEYDIVHTKPLHLILVRRDLAGFQHVHPELDPVTGTWTSKVDLVPGSWRVYADFRATGADPLTLGTDLTVPGRVAKPAETVPNRTDDVAGYTVTLEGALLAGQDSELTLSVSRAGDPVMDLQPYLGSYGHLVALREGDLAYLHVHPHKASTSGPDIDFTTAVPSEGRYRLFLDFAHAGVARTAVFTVEVDR